MGRFFMSVIWFDQGSSLMREPGGSACAVISDAVGEGNIAQQSIESPPVMASVASSAASTVAKIGWQ